MANSANDHIHSLVTDNIDIWTNAITKRNATGRGSNKKIELTGIKKLRELILELAVRGKLVPQDPTDESALVLLDRISTEKELLIKEGKLKKKKPLPDISECEKPFELPQGWECIRLGELGYTQTGGTPSKNKPEYFGSEIPFIKPGDILNGKIGYSNEGLSPLGAMTLGRIAPASSLLMVCIGTIGKCSYIDRDCAFNQQINSITPYVNITEYLFKAISSSYFQNIAWELSASTTIAIINKGKWESIPVVLPPLKEQHRIVAKVDELMALCDQLESQTENSLSAHQTLVEVLLSTLTSSADAKEFQSNWARIAEHFDTLFTTEHAIDQLKQTILQLAVMGKLVPQNPNDEPASILIGKITQEKKLLIKEKKIKKHPDVEPIGDSVELPSSWISIVVQDFADIRLGSTPSRSNSQYWNGDIPWVSSGEVSDFIIYDTKEKITEQGFEKSSVSMIPKRSMLMAIIGQGKTRGQTALLGIDACTNQNVAAFIFNEHYVLPEFVRIWAQSKYDAHRGDGRGGAQPALNGRIVRSFKFPLPPFDEQTRIVAKVDELFALCLKLKASISHAQSTQVQIAETLVEQAVK